MEGRNGDLHTGKWAGQTYWGGVIKTLIDRMAALESGLAGLKTELQGRLSTDKVTRSGAVTEPGWAVDARELNAATAGTLANRVSGIQDRIGHFQSYHISVDNEDELLRFVDGLAGNFTIYCNRDGAVSRIDGFIITGSQGAYGSLMRLNYFYNKHPVEFRQKYNGAWSGWMNPGETWDSFAG